MNSERMLLMTEKRELEELLKFVIDMKMIAFRKGNDFDKWTDAICERTNNQKTLRAIFNNGGKGLKELGRIFCGTRMFGETARYFEILEEGIRYQIAACNFLLGEPIEEEDTEN